MAAGNMATDTIAPTVSFVSPSAGGSVSGNAGITVSASDNVGVSSVVLKIDGVDQAVDVVAPYTFVWNTVAASNGTHNLTAVGTDAAGNTTAISIPVTVNNSIDLSAPTVTVLSPVTNSVVSGTVSVLVDANDGGGRVARVELYVDGKLTASSTSAPFTTKWNTRKLSAGLHLVQCKAYMRPATSGLRVKYR